MSCIVLLTLFIVLHKDISSST